VRRSGRAAYAESAILPRNAAKARHWDG